MQKYYFPADIRRADVVAAEECGVPSVVLMENAAKSAAREAELLADGVRGPFVVLAGVGNNGGDGFAAARHLLIGGADVVVLKCADDERYKNDAAVNLSILRRLKSEKLRICDTPEMTDAEISALLDEAACVMDGLLGTGTTGAPRKEAARLLALLDGRQNVVALDIPSGIDPASGAVYEPCAKAAVTVTFLAPKFGMAFEPAKSVCGKVVTADIGVPPFALLPEEPALTLLTGGDMRSLMPQLPRDVHKTQRGNVLIIAGSAEYRGAPLLAARGALRAGAGLVFLAVPEFIAPYASERLPEAIVVPLAVKSGEILSRDAENVLSEIAPKCGSVVAGPGCGRSDGADELFVWLWHRCALPMLLDADMLWFFARHRAELPPRGDVLLTPHSAEAGRILGMSAAEVDSQRAECARKLTYKTGNALLKGRDTLVASGCGLKMIGAGSPVLAVPGSGDTLSGIIGAFIASGMSVGDAAAAGALAHAKAGEALEAKRGVRGTLATEIADEIPSILR